MDDLGLFDTLVPTASIITIFILIGYTIPKHQWFGLFLLGWWVMSVVISLQNNLFQQSTQWNYPRDYIGIFILLGIPGIMVAGLIVAFQQFISIRNFILKVPAWFYLLLHVYRLDGLSLIMPFLNGEIPKYLGFQMLLLDVIIGATSIPVAIAIYKQYKKTTTTTSTSTTLSSFSSKTIKERLWFWNSLGLYDLLSAYLVLLCNFFGFGGTLIVQPPMAMIGFHPIPLLVLFQGPLAIAIHILFLTQLDVLCEYQARALPLYY